MDSQHDDFGDGLDDPVLAELLTELRAIAHEPAPAIGPDLAAVIGGAVPLATSRTRSRAASMLVVGLVSTGVLTGGISAAAADQLPAPVQRVVARVVNTMTPFEIPDRAVRTPIERTPDEEATVQPSPAERDEDTPPPDVVPAPSPAEPEHDHQSGGEDGDRGSSTGDSAEDGDRSIDHGTRDEDEDEDRDADQRDLDSDDSESDAPDEPSTGDGSGGSDGSDDGSDDGSHGSGDDSDDDDDGVESEDVDD